MQKWTLAEGIEKLLPTNRDDAEISDLGISKRRLILDVSIAEGQTEDEEPGISVILSTTGEEEYLHFHSEVIVPMEGESLQSAVHRIAKMLGIEPGERVWENGEQL